MRVQARFRIDRYLPGYGFLSASTARLVAVAEEQHFGRAARRLNLTQPPLTRQVQALEGALGVSLFDRSGRGVRLTTAGEVFLAHCRRVLALIDVAPVATRRAADGQTRTLRLASPPSARTPCWPTSCSP
jgi:DNA-binding transcriptional LysR family regulator